MEVGFKADEHVIKAAVRMSARHAKLAIASVTSPYYALYKKLADQGALCDRRACQHCGKDTCG